MRLIRWGARKIPRKPSSKENFSTRINGGACGARGSFSESPEPMTSIRGKTFTRKSDSSTLLLKRFSSRATIQSRVRSSAARFRARAVPKKTVKKTNTDQASNLAGFFQLDLLTAAVSQTEAQVR